MLKKVIKNFLANFDLEIRTKTSDAKENSDFNRYRDKLISTYPDITISKKESGSEYVEIDDMNFNINTLEEYYILCEVLIDKCYDLYIPSKAVVFDVGMNVGITTIYFAQKLNVTKIYGFEPVFETFSDAKRNIDLNVAAKQKSIMFNFGLGSINEIQRFHFDPNFKGSVGKVDSINIDRSSDKTKIIKVNIANATETLSPLLEKHKGELKILKLDCEGGEFDIIKDLSDTKLIRSFDVLIIEWHQQNPISIINSLLDNYFVIREQSDSNALGMIYAFNLHHAK